MNNSMSKQIPGLRLAWDATSLGELKTCPYKLHLQQSWEPRLMPLPLKFGILFHSGIEVFDKALASGAERSEALRRAVRKVLTDSGRQAGEAWVPWDTSKQRKGNYLNLVTLVRALVWYEARWRDDKAETYILPDGRPAVELSFKLDVPDITASTGEPYVICGHLDKVVRFAGQLWVMDRKTTARKDALTERYWSQFRPHNQFSLYTIAANTLLPEPVAGVLVDGVHIKVNSCDFGRQAIQRTPQELEEWWSDTMQWIKIAEHFATTNNWIRNDGSCQKFFGCPFQDICSMPAALRPTVLPNLWKPTSGWDPLKNR